jgi:hypothetical protein
MQATITEQKDGKIFFLALAECGKTKAEIMICKDNGRINVVCKNASHRVWQGGGKWFDSADKAIENYRSPQMRLIIGQVALAFLAQ